MPKFFTVQRGSEKKRILAGELAEFEKDGWSLTGTERVVTEAGEQTYDTAAALDILASEPGSRLVTPEEIRARRGQEFLERRYGSEDIQTFGESGLISRSFGLLDPALEKLSEVTSGDPGAVAARQRANPTAALAGSITGAVTGALSPGVLPGRLGQFARLTPTGAATTASEQLALRLARQNKVAQTAIQGFSEGALYGAGQAYANAVINDDPVNAESIVASMGSEALFGGALGGALGLTTVGFGKLSNRLQAAKAAKAEKAVFPLPEAQLDELKAIGNKLTQNVDTAVKEVLSDVSINPATQLAELSPTGRLKSFSKADFEALYNTADDVVRLSEVAERMGVLAQDLDFKTYKKFVTVQGKAVKESANKLSKLGRDVTKLEPEQFKEFVTEYNNLEALYADYERGVLPALRTKTFQSLPKLGSVNTDDFGKLLQKNEDLKQFAGPLTDGAGQATELGVLLSDELGLDISEITGSETLETVAKVWAANRLLRGRGAQTPTGKAVQSGFRGKAATGVNAIDKRIGGIIGAASNQIRGVKERINAGIDGFIKAAGKPRKGTVPAATTILGKIRYDSDIGERPKAVTHKYDKRTADFLARRSELMNAMANPERTKANIKRQLSGLYAVKPNVANAALLSALDQLKFLHGLLPSNPGNPRLGPDRWVPSKTEVDKFARIAAVADNPLSIIDDMNSGKLTQEAVDTVKRLYPEIYAAIQLRLLHNIDQIRSDVSYNGRIQLGIFFQVPTDQVLEPGVIMKMQENYAVRAMEQEQGDGQFSTPGSFQNSLTNVQTASQQLESK